MRISVVKDVDLEAMPTSIFLNNDDDDDDDDQLKSQFNEKRPHRTHRAKWPLTYAHNKTKKINKTNMQNL